MPRAAQLPPLSKNAQRAAARASREHDDGRALKTIQETAVHLNKSKHTVYRLIRNGDLRAIKVEGTLRVRPGDLAAYLDRNVVS
jgi:excisionase family DNA binding protein